MRSFFYLQLQERLEQLPDRQGVPAVRTYDLWNEQVDFIEEEEPFDMPAVFLEFMPYKWTTLSGAVQQAAVTVRLHVVTPWKGSSRKGSRYQQQSLERFSLLEEINRQLGRETAVACPACGAESRPGDVFCRNCGGKL